MSRLDDLIRQYCPDGVEHKRLGDIAIDIFRGGRNKKRSSKRKWYSMCAIW